MKKIKYIRIAFLVIFISLIGCESDDMFLKEEPITFYTTDNAFSTSAQVDQVLVSIYSHIRDLWVNPTEQVWIFNFRGKGTDMYDVPIIRKGNTFANYSTINPDHDTFYQVYSTWYYVIARANLAIYAAELPEISWGSESEKAYVLAQARFFRAFAYRNLAELFGGVPIVTEISTAPRYDFEPVSRIETYQFAIDEMEAIENSFPCNTLMTAGQHAEANEIGAPAQANARPRKRYGEVPTWLQGRRTLQIPPPRHLPRQIRDCPRRLKRRRRQSSAGTRSFRPIARCC